LDSNSLTASQFPGGTKKIIQMQIEHNIYTYTGHNICMQAMAFLGFHGTKSELED
jgi:hypothetical protein